MNKKYLILIPVLLLIAFGCCRGQNQQNSGFNDTVKLSNFSWLKTFEGGGGMSNVKIFCTNKMVLINEYDRIVNRIINKYESDSIGNIVISSKEIAKRGFYISGYLQSKDTVIQYPRTYHQISTYHIPLTDTTKIKKLDLKYTRECPRGCDSKSSLTAYFSDKTLELKFTRNMTIGSMYIHDIVQYDATSFVISFWYYKRGGGEWISDVRVGLLDLKQYLK
jgi:hypothetical protein